VLFRSECPIHGEIEDGEEERDAEGDAICPIPTGETSSNTKVICGKPLDFWEDDGESQVEDDFDE